MIIELDLIQLTKWELNINEYLTILKIKYLNDDVSIDLPYFSTEKTLESLVNKGLLEEDNGNMILTDKVDRIIKKEKIIFDDLFNLYPYKTPNGRPLRSKNKEILGHVTRDYKILSEKYLSKIKTEDLHQSVLQATRLMINDLNRRGSLNYLPKFETFINQSSWEKFMDIDGDSKKSEGGKNIERL
jgi:hypothetical protein